MRILSEDPRWLAIDKPAGIPTIPDRFGSPSVVDLLSATRGEKLWVVHRLDREVTGILLFARDAAAHRALSLAFERHLAAKTYAALTEGTAPEPGTRFHWENLLLRGKKRSYESPVGKPAITDAEFVGSAGAALRWRLTPKTGRNHQLRVHLYAAGFPILGDALYGARAPWDEGIALRAIGLTIPAGEGLPAIALTAEDLPAPTGARSGT